MEKLDVLFVHNNFPAQFRNLAEHLGQQPNVRLKAIGSQSAASAAGIDLHRYWLATNGPRNVHTFARRFDSECRRAEHVMYAANAMKAQGFSPDLIYVHSGWGEAMPLRCVFPSARIAVYAEYYYRTQGTDVGFDTEFGQLGTDGETRVALRNASTLLALADSEAAFAPTQWQRSLFPKEFSSKIATIHDGVDTDALKFTTHRLAQDAETVTYVARNLEPYRGFHAFMRALPIVLRARPNAHVQIVGGDGVSYGNPPVGFKTWREAMLAELGSELDLSRVHFNGSLSYKNYIALLRRSDVHVYLTYPFVLSWSLLEAMSLGCNIIGSDTSPVREVITDGVNGTLTPFADQAALADRIITALAQPKRFDDLRRNARQTVIDRFDLRRVVLPAQRSLIEQLLPGCRMQNIQPEGDFSNTIPIRTLDRVHA